MTYVNIGQVVESWWQGHLAEPDNNECEECDAFASPKCDACWECQHGQHCSEITWDFPVDAVVAAVEDGLTCLVWQATGDDGEPLESSGWQASDITAESVTEFARDLADFWHGNHPDLKDLDAGQVGHDFVLTRNGHGAGFWDRGLGEQGDRLTEACRPYGTFDLYVGDDGKLYAHA